MKNLWLTVNRRCNIRCEWCYAGGTDYSLQQEMTFDFAKKLINVVASKELKNIIILGGEPTLWKPLPKLLHWIANDLDLDIVPTVVTNGIRFANNDFISTLDNCEYNVSLSMKSANRYQHKLLTKSDTFDKVLKAISNLSKSNIAFGVSVTVNTKIIDNLVEMAKVVSEVGAKNISFEMCVPSFDKDSNPNNDFVIHPKVLADKIVESYDDICKIFDGMVSYQLSIPFCLFPVGFIDNLKERNQIISGCHVMERNGVIFDPTGNVLLCNCLHHIPIGLYGTDFIDQRSFKNWWNQDDIVSCNQQLLRYPSKKCIKCSDYEYCGGGCPLQWFSFNPCEILNS